MLKFTLKIHNQNEELKSKARIWIDTCSKNSYFIGTHIGKSLISFFIASSSVIYAMDEIKESLNPIDHWMELLHEPVQIDKEYLTNKIFDELQKLMHNGCEKSAYKLGKFYAIGSFSLMEKFNSLNSQNKKNMANSIDFLKKGGVEGLSFLCQCYEKCNGPLDKNPLLIYADILKKINQNEESDICPNLIKDRIQSKQKSIDTYIRIKNFILNLEQNKKEGCIDFATQQYLFDYMNSLYKQDIFSIIVKRTLDFSPLHSRLFMSLMHQKYPLFNLSLSDISSLSILLKNTWNDGQTELPPYESEDLAIDHPMKRSEEHIYLNSNNNQSKDLISFL